MLYVIETDAPCKNCTKQHGYVTSMCDLVIWADYATARDTARVISGSIVREIAAPPDGITYKLDIRKDGKPDPRYPAAQSPLPRG